MDLAKVKKNTGSQYIISDSCFYQRITHKYRNKRSNRFNSPLMIFCRNAGYIITKRLEMLVSIKINYRKLIKSSPIIITKSEGIKLFSLYKQYNLNNIELKNIISEIKYVPNKPSHKVEITSFHVRPYTEMINIWNDFYYLFSENKNFSESMRTKKSFELSGSEITLISGNLIPIKRTLSFKSQKKMLSFPSLLLNNLNSGNSIANREYFASVPQFHSHRKNDYSILLKPELTISSSRPIARLKKYSENPVKINQKNTIISNENFRIFHMDERYKFQNIDNIRTIMGFSGKNMILENGNGISELVFPTQNNNSGNSDQIDKDRTSMITKSRIDTLMNPLDMVLRKPAIVNDEAGIEDIKLQGRKIKPQNPKTGDISNEKNPDEIGNIANKVYKIIERRLSIEKEKRGHL